MSQLRLNLLLGPRCTTKKGPLNFPFRCRGQQSLQRVSSITVYPSYLGIIIHLVKVNLFLMAALIIGHSFVRRMQEFLVDHPLDVGRQYPYVFTEGKGGEDCYNAVVRHPVYFHNRTPGRRSGYRVE